MGRVANRSYLLVRRALVCRMVDFEATKFESALNLTIDKLKFVGHSARSLVAQLADPNTMCSAPVSPVPAMMFAMMVSLNARLIVHRVPVCESGLRSNCECARE